MKRGKESVNYLEASFATICFKLGLPIFISSALSVVLTMIQNAVISQSCPEYFTVSALVSTAVSNITVISGGFVSAVWAKYSLSFVTGGDKSKKNLANSLVTIVVCQAVIELLGIVFADPILRFLNTPVEIYHEAKRFLIWFTAVSIFSTLSSLATVMCNGLDSPGGILTLNVLNQIMPCGLLVLMLRVFKLGLIGGAIYAGVSAAVMATIGFARLLLQKETAASQMAGD